MRRSRSRRRNRGSRQDRRKIIILVSGIASALALVIVLLLFREPITLLVAQIQGKAEEYGTPDQLVERYYSYIEEKRYEEMYAMLEENSKANISAEDFIIRNQKIYEGIEAENIKVEIIDVLEQDNNSVVVSYDVQIDTLAGMVSFSNQTVFIADQEDKYQYAFCWDDSMIYPELTSGDKVKVSLEEAQRGNILDRNGVVLAGEGTASSVGLVPGKMNEDSSQDIEQLAAILGISPENVSKKLEAKWVKDDSFVPLKTIEKLTKEEEAEEEPSEAVLLKMEKEAALLQIPGIMISDTKIWQYPLGKAGSHLIGYIQKVTAEDLEEHPGEGYHENSYIGRSGVESLYEKELKGQNGYEIAITDSEGNVKTTIAHLAKQDGKNIYLTIDSALQRSIYEKYAEDKSCSVAMNPYTGEVLALVSTPSYDSNDFMFGMSSELWNSLNEDERQPLYNRFRQKLCPGSSLKPITAAIGLKSGAIDPEEDFGNVGLSWQKDSSWGNYHVTTLHAYDPVVLENALIYSDNIYFAKAALKIGKEQLQEGLEELGFGGKLPFEIAVAESQYSNTDKIESEILLADSGYGQGEILVNPIHLASLYTGFANEGDVIKPYLLYQEEAKSEVWLPSAYLPEHAAIIEQALEQVVQSEHGTGHGVYRSDIALAGKTGTAELKLTKEDQNGTELGWFGVFTVDKNIENPLLLLNMVEDVKERGGSGYAVGKDKKILEDWFGSEE